MKLKVKIIDGDRIIRKEIELRNTYHFETQRTTRGLVHRNKKKYNRKRKENINYVD